MPLNISASDEAIRRQRFCSQVTMSRIEHDLKQQQHFDSKKIEFEKNSALLKESLGNNGEMIQKIKSDLEALMKNAEFDLDSIIVSATASPEGAITVNQRFSGQRSDAVSNYFRNFYSNDYVHKCKC